MFKSFLRLSLGNIFGGLVSIVWLLFLPHFYSASQLGIYFLALSFATLLSIFISQGRDPVLISVKSEQQAMTFVPKTMRILIRNSLIVSFFAFLMQSLFEVPTEFSMLEMSLVLLIALTYSVFTIFFSFALRHEKFKLLSLRNPVQNLAIGSLQIIGSFIYPSVYMLLLCEILGRLIGLFPLSRYFTSYKSKNVQFSLVLPDTFTDTKKISKFMFLSNLVEASGMLIVLRGIEVMFGSGAMGQLGWALRICIVPISVLAISLGQVYLTTFTKSFTDPSQFLFNLFKRHVGIGVVVSSIIFIVFCWLLPSLLNIYSPQGWDSLSGLVQNLALFAASKFLWDAFSQFYNVMNMWRQLLLASCFRMLSLFSALLYISLAKAPLLQSITLAFGALAVSQLVLLIYVYYKVSGFLKSR